MLRLRGTTQSAVLDLNDLDGADFLQQLVSFYSGVCGQVLNFDIRALSLQFTPLKNNDPTDYHHICSLEATRFSRQWRKTLEFVTKHRAFDEFDVEIRQHDTAG